MGTMKTMKPHEELRAKRRAMDWSQEALAAKLGISASLLSRWESGDREPTKEQAEKWKRALR